MCVGVYIYIYIYIYMHIQIHIGRFSCIWTCTQLVVARIELGQPNVNLFQRAVCLCCIVSIMG